MGRDCDILAAGIVRSRFSQLAINERFKFKMFNISVYLALGHEAFSEAVAATMQSGDKLACSYRSIYCQLARGASLFDIPEMMFSLFEE